MDALVSGYSVSMAKLSTHVLDTSTGIPAPGVRIELHHITSSSRVLLATSVTNENGRTDEPLRVTESFEAGVYELTFHAGAYFRGRNIPLPQPAFLDEIVIRFGIADTHADYHIPLLLSPWGYTTYRGS